MFSGYLYVGNGENSNWTATGFFVRKYMDESVSLGSDNASTNTFIDMRLAEVYLNYAEATVENGSGYGDQALALFIQPPSIEELEKRLKHRATDAPEVIASRVAKAEYELSFAPRFDHIIVNDILEKAQEEAYQTIRQFLDKP